MRKIEKQPEPKSLSEWRSKHKADPNFGYDLLAGKPAHAELKASLIKEQGGLCAYTGQRINADNAHIEHLFPQTHCTPGESVDYQNLTACFPCPNALSPGYGAIQKGSWPGKQERHLFVSPLFPDCEARFRFDSQGRIFAAKETDGPATETINRLALDHSTLRKNREAALRFIKTLNLKAARLRLNGLQQETHPLSPYCFALKQVLIKRIQTVEHIKRQQSP